MTTIDRSDYTRGKTIHTHALTHTHTHAPKTENEKPKKLKNI